MKSKLILSVIISALSISGCSILPSDNITLDFYNLNDFHGAVMQNGEEPGIFKLASFLNQQMAKNKNYSIFTNSGDMWQGSADSNLTSGALVNSWLNYMGCKAMALGNHEFDWKISKIVENEEDMNFPLLACNVYDSTTETYVTDWLEPYTIVEKGDVKIGFIGAIGEGLTSSISSANVKGLWFVDPMEKIAEYSDYLRKNENCDVVMLLLHDDVEKVSNNLATYVDGVFLGHSHKYYKGYFEKGGLSVPYVQGWSNGKAVSHIQIKLNKNQGKYRIASSYGEFIFTTSSNLTSYSEDSGSIAVYNQFADQIEEIKNREVANLPFSMDQYYDIPFYYNKYACDYYRNVLEGEYEIMGCVTNYGRARLDNGVITYGDIYKSLPFDNFLTVMYISGNRLSQIAEGYDQSRWYIPSADQNNLVDNNSVRSCFENTQKYYFLSIDYISAFESYSSWMNIVETYEDDASAPRNIFARGVALEFPL